MPPQNNKAMYFIKRSLLLYFLLFAITIPGIWPEWMDVPAFMKPFFASVIKFIAGLLNIHPGYNLAVESDSMGMYIQCGFLFFIAIFLAALSIFCKQLYLKKANNFIEKIITYYLAFSMLQYGFNKLFKVQFYAPEPNTLFTSVGQMQKDFLFWTSMGTSRLYSVVTGSVEVFSGILLLSYLTKNIGHFIAFLCMANIFLLNISFDISVKLLSLTLLLISIYFSLPFAKRLLAALLQHNNCAQKVSIKPWPLLAGATLLIITLIPYLRSGNFNDDAMARPPLHGAYTVINSANDLHTPSNWKKCFVHRRGYFIIQYQNDAMESFSLQIDTTKNVIQLSNDSLVGNFNFSRVANNQLALDGTLYRDTIHLELEKLDIDSLPLNKYKLRYIAE